MPECFSDFFRNLLVFGSKCRRPRSSANWSHGAGSGRVLPVSGSLVTMATDDCDERKMDAIGEGKGVEFRPPAIRTATLSVTVIPTASPIKTG